MSDQDDRLTAEELAAISEAFAASAKPKASTEVRAESAPIVLRYDLLGATTAQRHDYPALDLIHETFSLHLGTALQRATRQEATFAPQRPDLVNFSEVYASLPNPCAVIVLELAGMGSTALLVIDPLLLLHFIDLLIGGPGGAIEATELLASRSFTATERHLIGHLVGYVGRALEAAWAEVTPIGARMLRAEADPRHSAVFMPSDRVAEFRIDVAWGDVIGDIRLVIPMAALRPFEKRLTRTAVSPPTASDAEWQATVRESLDDVPVTLVGVLGRKRMTLRELLRLAPGDLIRLDRDPDGPLDLLVQGVPKYEVRAQVQGGNMAAELLGPLPAAEGGGAGEPPDEPGLPEEEENP